MVVLLLLRVKNMVMLSGGIKQKGVCVLYAKSFQDLGALITWYFLQNLIFVRLLIVKCLLHVIVHFMTLEFQGIDYMREKFQKLLTDIAIFLIRFYQSAISPLFPACCRFTPTCSEYGMIAFRRYGFKKGFVLTAKRILKCRPGGPHGYDPVP